MIKPLIWALSAVIVANILIGNVEKVSGEEPPLPTPRLELSGPRQFTEPKPYLYYLAGTEEAPLLDRIIQCESGWKVDIKNANSSASGLAQFLDSTWRTTRERMWRPDPDLLLKHDWKEHIDTFVWLYEQDGTRHWLESKSCWNSYE